MRARISVPRKVMIDRENWVALREIVERVNQERLQQPVNPATLWATYFGLDSQDDLRLGVMNIVPFEDTSMGESIIEPIINVQVPATGAAPLAAPPLAIDPALMQQMPQAQASGESHLIRYVDQRGTERIIDPGTKKLLLSGENFITEINEGRIYVSDTWMRIVFEATGVWKPRIDRLQAS